MQSYITPQRRIRNTPKFDLLNNDIIANIKEHSPDYRMIQNKQKIKLKIILPSAIYHENLCFLPRFYAKRDNYSNF